MKLFLIAQEKNQDYDTYDSAVVCAPNEEKAKRTHPSTQGIEDWPKQSCMGTWVPFNHVEKYVKVTYLGEAAEGVKEGVVCASFNAG